MTPDEQRIAIAEACGWTKIHFYEDNAGPGFWSGDPPPKLNAYWEVIDQRSDRLPDYLNDLNAVHKAWLTLIDGHESLEDKFNLAIDRLLFEGGFLKTRLIVSLRINATASVRAKAILIALGKWK